MGRTTKQGSTHLSRYFTQWRNLDLQDVSSKDWQLKSSWSPSVWPLIPILWLVLSQKGFIYFVLDKFASHHTSLIIVYTTSQMYFQSKGIFFLLIFAASSSLEALNTGEKGSVVKEGVFFFVFLLVWSSSFWRKHCFFKLQSFHNSEVKLNLLQWVMSTRPWSRSAWTSPSPWTPGVRQWFALWISISSTIINIAPRSLTYYLSRFRISSEMLLTVRLTFFFVSGECWGGSL